MSYYVKLLVVIKMKLLIISDIHGNYDSMLKVIENESFDRLIVLGDLFSYYYDYEDDEENKILELLEKYKNKLVLIKGNCDCFINYEAYNLYAHDEISLTFNKHTVTFTHGHFYNKTNLPKYHGNIFISGHTHIPLLIKENNMYFCNPGSIGSPRNNSNKGYLIFEDNKLILKDINKNILKKLIIN